MKAVAISLCTISGGVGSNNLAGLYVFNKDIRRTIRVAGHEV